MPIDSAFALITFFILSPDTDPGHIALTLILNSTNSIAKDFVRPIIAHLLAAYGVLNGKPKIPAVDDKLIIDPPFIFNNGIAFLEK